MTGLLPLLDQFRGLQPVEPRHLHVEEDHREGFAQHVQQRLFAGPRLHQAHPEGLEDPLEGEEVLRPIVDHQDAGNDGSLVLGSDHVISGSTW